MTSAPKKTNSPKQARTPKPSTPKPSTLKPNTLKPSTPKRRARSFQRTRADHAQETAEDYVEAIADVLEEKQECRGADLARLFGVSHVTVTKTVARLQSEGLVDSEPYGPLNLTSAGKKLAAASRRRHEIVLDLLIALGVSPEVAAVDSEGIEHHVSEETLTVFQKFLEARQDE